MGKRAVAPALLTTWQGGHSERGDWPGRGVTTGARWVFLRCSRRENGPPLHALEKHFGQALECGRQRTRKKGYEASCLREEKVADGREEETEGDFLAEGRKRTS